MIKERLQRLATGYVVAIPDEEVERRGLEVGQLVMIEITPVESEPVLRPELRDAMDESWDRDEPALRYLAER